MNYHCSWSTRNGCNSPTTGTHKQIQECTVHHTVTMLCSTLEPLQLWCINATLFCPFHPNSYLLRTRYSWFVINIHIWSITHEKNQQEWGEEGEIRHCISPIQPLSKGPNHSALLLDDLQDHELPWTVWNTERLPPTGQQGSVPTLTCNTSQEPLLSTALTGFVCNWCTVFNTLPSLP